MTEEETLAIATIQACKSIYDPEQIRCQEDAERMTLDALALRDGAQWVAGDVARDACDRLVKLRRDFKGLELPTPAEQIKQIIGGIAGRCNKSKRTVLYWRTCSTVWPRWEDRAIGWLDHTCFIKAVDTGDPHRWIAMAKERRWQPNQLLEAYHVEKGDEIVGDPIIGDYHVNKMSDDEREFLHLDPTDGPYIPFAPRGEVYEVRFVRLRQRSVGEPNGDDRPAVGNLE